MILQFLTHFQPNTHEIFFGSRKLTNIDRNSTKRKIHRNSLKKTYLALEKNFQFFNSYLIESIIQVFIGTYVHSYSVIISSQNEITEITKYYILISYYIHTPKTNSYNFFIPNIERIEQSNLTRKQIFDKSKNVRFLSK